MPSSTAKRWPPSGVGRESLFIETPQPSLPGCGVAEKERLTLKRGPPVARGPAAPAGHGGGLPDPGDQLLLVEYVLLSHIHGARVLLLAGEWNGLERGALEER